MENESDKNKNLSEEDGLRFQNADIKRPYQNSSMPGSSRPSRGAEHDTSMQQGTERTPLMEGAEHGTLPTTDDASNRSTGCALANCWKKLPKPAQVFLGVCLAIFILAGVAGVGVGIAVAVFHGQITEDCKATPPPHGSVHCQLHALRYECDFFCNDGYGLRGQKHNTCRPRGWSHAFPTCDIVCPQLEDPTNGIVKCDGIDQQMFVNTKCTYTCAHGHIVDDPKKKDAICESDGTWSEVPPICVCPECYVGQRCELEMTWKNVSGQLKSYDGKNSTVLQVQYGEETFFCHSVAIRTNNWEGHCEEHKHGETVACRNAHTSPSDAITDASATLIRKMIDRGWYEKPCDFQDMPKSC